MPDNSAAIAKLEAILASGVRSGAADGESITYDPDSIRDQLAHLKRTDTTTRGRRPFCSNMNLGGSK